MKKTILAALAFVLLIAAGVIWGVKRDRALELDYGRIRIGMSESQVIEILGEPKRDEKCGDFLGPIAGEEAKGCAHEFLYASTFAPAVPQYFVVRFGENGRVKCKAVYTSP
jgi:hypothetical protein